MPTLHNPCCSFFPNSLLTLVARGFSYANRELLPAARFGLLFFHLLLSSVAADCLIFVLRCSLITYHRFLLAANTFLHNARTSLKKVCCIPLAYRFSMLGSCFALLTACCPVLLPGSLLLAVFSFLTIRCSLLFTLYSLLAVYRLYLIRVSLMAAAAVCLLLAA